MDGTPSRDERLDELRRRRPLVARASWLYTVALAVALGVAAAAFFVLAALRDDAAFVGGGVLVVAPALLLGWMAWLGRSLGRRRAERGQGGGAR